MIEKILAGATLVVCIGLLIRMVLPSWQRHRLDRYVRTTWRRLQSAVVGPYRGWRLRRGAARMTQDVIRRAREGQGEWTGNVYRPTSFKRPRKDVERPPSKEH